MDETTSHQEQLIPLLRQAANRFLALGHSDIWNSDDFTDDLGHFCNQVADKLEEDTLSDEEKKRIFFIFAPTCEWDDSVGDVALGNKVFSHLKALYRDLALKKD
jgi:hypothetical protein